MLKLQVQQPHLNRWSSLHGRAATPTLPAVREVGRGCPTKRLRPTALSVGTTATKDSRRLNAKSKNVWAAGGLSGRRMRTPLRAGQDPGSTAEDAPLNGAAEPTRGGAPSASGGGRVEAEAQPAPNGLCSSLAEAPDMYLIRSDGFTCEREVVHNRELKVTQPSAEQLMLVWRSPPATVLVLKKIGVALLPQMVQTCAALLRLGVQLVVERSVLRELRQWGTALDPIDSPYRSEDGDGGRHLAAKGGGAGGHMQTPGEHSVALRAVLAGIGEGRVDKLVKGEYGTVEAEQRSLIDCIVCLGGDGVILHASTLFQDTVPVLTGFNLGSMGFLCQFPAAGMMEGLKSAVGRRDVAYMGTGHEHSSSVRITLRMRLHCRLKRRKADPERDGERESFTVLNEVLVDRGPSPFLSKIECYNCGQLITKVQADGIMLATPTGSTAYSAAAGGAMVHPSIPAILMTPICPHSLSFRPVLLPDSARLELRVPMDARSSAWVSFDGKHRCELRRGDSVEVCMSPHPMPTVNYEDQTADFFNSLARCLNWNDRDEQEAFDSETQSVFDALNADLTTLDLCSMDEADTLLDI